MTAPAQKHHSVFNIAVIVAALGYFVDIYDLLLFTIVREPSLKGLGVDLTNTKEVIHASTMVINWQMWGLLIGGINWGGWVIKRKTECSLIHYLFHCQFFHRLCTGCTAICICPFCSGYRTGR
jgi:hypothetical protein